MKSDSQNYSNDENEMSSQHKEPISSYSDDGVDDDENLSDDHSSFGSEDAEDEIDEATEQNQALDNQA